MVSPTRRFDGCETVLDIHRRVVSWMHLRRLVRVSILVNIVLLLYFCVVINCYCIMEVWLGTNATQPMPTITGTVQTTN